MLYTVGEMAKRIGVPASTLRYYDKEGLLPFVERSQSGNRMFTDNDYGYFRIIDCLKRSGLTIREIREFIDLSKRGDETLAQRLELFQSRRQAVLEQMQALQKTLDVLEYKCWYYEKASQDGTEQNVSTMPIEALPQEYQDVKRSLRLKK